MSAYMLTSPVFRRVYMAWVARYERFARIGHFTPEWKQAHDQVSRMQQMYDSLEGGMIVYLWQWHNFAIQKVRDENWERITS